MESLSYFYDRYMIVGEGQIIHIVITVFIAVTFTIAIYFFTENKWGSICMAPFLVAMISTVSLKYLVHLYFLLLSMLISHIIIHRLDSNKGKNEA